MPRNVKKILAFVLAMMLLLPILAGCQGGGKEGSGDKPTPTEPAEEAKVLKVLTLGHSLAVDAGHMLAMVANAEGYEDMLVGTLYYSGCPLSKHVEHLLKDEAAYDLYISSTQTPKSLPAITEGVTMKYALNYEYWDIIVMQGGTFEVTDSQTYTNGDIQKIQEYVKENVVNPLAIMAWHMPWAFPVDKDLLATQSSGTFDQRYAQFGHDRSKFFDAMTTCVKDHILTDETFRFLIPSGTAIENALSSYLEEKELHRDYAHANDLGRLIAAYTYYCSLTGVEKLEQIKVDMIPKSFLKTNTSPTGWELTEDEKALILESVNNALKEPLQMTQSQFTTAPAK